MNLIEWCIVWQDGNSKLFVNHECEDSHLCGTSVVELNSALLQFCLFIKGIPSEINEVVTEVTWEFTSNIVSHDGNLKDTNEERNLGKSKRWHLLQGSKSSRNIREFGSIIRDESWKTSASSSE